jgi:chromosome segregation ATPase
MSNVVKADIGHNNPPDPIDEALAPYGDAIEEAGNWLDGTPVETEDQMKSVDALIKEIRSAKSDLAKAKKSATAPLHDAWKAEVARWKPTEEDIERRLKGLAAVVDPFKRKLAEEKEAAKRAAYEEARRKEREAEEAARKADASDYEAATEAARLKDAAIEAKKAAAEANKDTVKGLRTVTRYIIEDHKKLLHWIAKNDRDAVTAFIEEWARRNHKSGAIIDGLRVWTEKEAF